MNNIQHTLNIIQYTVFLSPPNNFDYISVTQYIECFFEICYTKINLKTYYYY